MELSVKHVPHNFQEIQSVLTEDQWARVRFVELDSQEVDKLIFSHTNSRKFSIAKYTAASRVATPEIVWSRYVWNRSSSHRANAFMWKVFHIALPVDRNIQGKGIVLASKCMCCTSPTTETLEHLLIHSELATDVRAFFTVKVNKQLDIRSVGQWIATWLPPR